MALATAACPWGMRPANIHNWAMGVDELKVLGVLLLLEFMVVVPNKASSRRG